MKITFTAKAFEKPHDLPLKADIAWRYFDINSTDNCGWSAGEVACLGVVLTDESNDFSCNSYIFRTDADFIEWLGEVADEHLNNDPADFLIAAGMIDGSIASDDVVAAVLDVLNKEETK